MKLLAALLVVTATAGSAWAEAPTKVFPLTGYRLPAPIAKAPEVLSRALAKTAGGEVALMRIEDLASSMDCDLEADTCLEAIMKSVHAHRIVYGSIVGRADGGGIVRLTWFDGTVREQKLVLTGDTAEDLADSLVYGLTDGARGQPAPRAKTKPKAKQTEKENEPEPEQPETNVDPGPVHKSSGPTTLTIGLIGGGAAVTLVGAGFLVSANSLKDQVNRAPTNTYDDLHYLASLERAGRLRTEIGAALMVGGAAFSAYGVYRLITENKEASHERAAVHVVPERGGASVTLTVGWP